MHGVSNLRRFLIVATFLATLCPFCDVSAIRAQTPAQGGGWLSPGRSNGSPQAVLTATPREIDLGALGPGEEAKGVFYLRNVGSGSTDWFTEGPDGWIPM